MEQLIFSFMTTLWFFLPFIIILRIINTLIDNIYNRFLLKNHDIEVVWACFNINLDCFYIFKGRMFWMPYNGILLKL